MSDSKSGRPGMSGSKTDQDVQRESIQARDFRQREGRQETVAYDKVSGLVVSDSESGQVSKQARKKEAIPSGTE